MINDLAESAHITLTDGTALITETNDLSSAVTWANVPTANIVEAAVTQHEDALSITESQITDLQSYLTSFTETNDLSTAVTWANVPSANITEAAVTQHEAALTITESQISDLAHTVDTDTQLSQEQVEDYAGGMVTGNTETGITVTYQASDNTLDFVAEVTQAELDDKADASHTHAASAITSGSFSNSRISEGNVTQHVAAIESALTISSIPGTIGLGQLPSTNATDSEVSSAVAALAADPSANGSFAATEWRSDLNVEDGADVTDTANVTSAGALMDSEVDADIKTLTIVASSSISGSNTGDQTAGDLGLGSSDDADFASVTVDAGSAAAPSVDVNGPGLYESGGNLITTDGTNAGLRFTHSGTNVALRYDGNALVDTLTFDATDSALRAWEDIIIQSYTTDISLLGNTAITGTLSATSTISGGTIAATGTLSAGTAGAAKAVWVAVPGTSVNTDIIWEGQTADAFEARLGTDDPNQDNNHLLPDKSGTIAHTSDTRPTFDTETAGRDVTAADVGVIIRYNNASAGNFPIQDDAEASWPEGSYIVIEQMGAGAATFTNDGGAITLNEPTGYDPTTGGQYWQIVAYRVGADTWTVGGRLAEE